MPDITSIKIIIHAPKNFIFCPISACLLKLVKYYVRIMKHRQILVSIFKLKLVIIEYVL